MHTSDANPRRARPFLISICSPWAIAFAAALVVVAGCSDEPESGTLTETDTGVEGEVDTGPDAETDADLTDTGDAGGHDTGDADVADTDVNGESFDPTHCPSEEATVEASPSAPVDIEQWVGAGIFPTEEEPSPVMDAIERGEFELPEPGDHAYGNSWNAIDREDDGEIDDSGVFGNVLYAGFSIDVDEPTVHFARADGVFQVFVNGLRQPGDIYSDGDKRIPIPLSEGDNDVVLRYSLQRPAEFELFETPDELYFNLEDVTAPQLRVGTDRTEQLGVPVLNLFGYALTDVEARVVENDYFEDSVVTHPALGPDAVTQLAFELEPKQAWEDADQDIPVRIQIASCQLETSYEIELTLQTVAEDATFNRTFRSPVDNSVQYYGVVPPKDVTLAEEYGLALSMHGASVEASSQARQYTQKETMYVIAPTNRRPFGFDWEEWGRLNALATLEHAKETFNIDASRVYATGHSMGGHGTWHLSVMHPGLFAALGPSAGWSTFYSYSGQSRPPEWLEPARAHSDTYAYMSNLERRGAYILHGDADTNVPLQEGQDLYDALTEYTDEVEFHIEPGADHWWDGDASEGQDCVDWPPMFEFFKERELDVTELDFEFRTPGQWIGAFHSYVTLQSTITPVEDGGFISEEVDDGVVELTTENVRAFDIDADALLERGADELIVDGDPVDISDGGTVEIGTREGKTKEAPGMLNPTFHRPFCFVYPDDDAEVFRAFTAHLLSTWALVGNGHGCALPEALLTDEIAEERNLIYVGFASQDIPEQEALEFFWDDETFDIAGNEFEDVAGFTTFPRGDHQGAAFFATGDAERLIFGHQPFSSRAGMGDFFIWTFEGGITGGFFDTSWELDPDLLAGG